MFVSLRGSVELHNIDLSLSFSLQDFTQENVC